MKPLLPHQHYYPERRENSRVLRWVAFAVFCLLLAPLFTGCGGGADLEEEVATFPPIPTGCAVYPRPPQCI